MPVIRFRYSLRALILSLIAVAIATAFVSSDRRRTIRAVNSLNENHCRVWGKKHSSISYILPSLRQFEIVVEDARYISQNLADFRHLPFTTRLTIEGNCALRDIENAVLSFPCLTYLDLERCDPQAIEVVTLCESLQHLSIRDTRYRGEDLSALRQLADLTVLNLAGTSVDDAGAEEISKLNHILQLNLSRTSITDAGIRSLSRCPRLTNLNVNETPISDQCLEHFRQYPALRELYIRAAGVSADGVELLMSSELTFLEVRSVWVDATTGKPEIQSSMPNCTIHSVIQMQRARIAF